MFLLCIGTSSIGSLLCGASEKNNKPTKQYRVTLSYFTHKLNFNRRFWGNLIWGIV